ncbi:MAG: hypothetical protein RM021_018455 [Nostoc sp. EkiNYC01]|nr:hypothetical protein [Nostoc sp. EkiNYC01]
MEKLKLPQALGENPGFDYLKQCWDDPALQIVIKKLLTKFPQWGIACVDGILVNWNLDLTAQNNPIENFP